MKESPDIHHESSDLLDAKEEKSDSSSPSRKHISEARSSRNRLFHKVKFEHGAIKQITNVNVHIEPDSEDPCTGCFKAIVGIFKK